MATPVNLKERIALLQQRATSASPHASSSPSSPFTSGGASASATAATSASSSSASTPASGSVSALRERIAKFEQKGGVPVPRGSFGLGAPPPVLAQTHEGSAARKRGELYGNRIASVSRATPASPPSALRQHLTGNGDVYNAHSLAPEGVGEPSDGSPVRKRCVSTSGLEGMRPASASVFPSSIMGTSSSFDEGESVDSDMPVPAMQLFVSDEVQAQASLARRSSISSADAMRSTVSDSSDGTQLPSVENGPLSPQSLKSPVLAGVSEDEEVPEALPSSIDDHVTEEDHQKFDSGECADNVAQEEAEARPETAEEKVEQEDFEDESSVKTPVVSTFAPSSTALPPAAGDATSLDGEELTPDAPSDDHTLSDVSTPSTGSPLSASLEVGERAFGEAHTYVVMPPSGSRDTTIENVLEQHDTPQIEGIGSSEETQESASSPDDAASVLGISTSSENRASTETVSVPSSISLPTQVTERTHLSPQSTGSSSSRLRSVPAPLSIQHDKQYSEPSLDPKTGPKSFHAVVHGKKTQASTANSSATLPRAAVPRAQVVIVHQQAGSHPDPGTPGSPDLSALVAQAMYLEQRLMGGDIDTPTPRTDAEIFESAPQSESKPDLASASRVSHVAFPRSLSTREALDKALDTAPVPLPKSPKPRTLSRAGAGAASRKSWSWSSENTSSDDSVPVLTPPSPTFDLVTPPLFDEREHALGLGAGEGGEQSDDESHRSIGSMLSSPGRSARKKVLSMFSRAGRSSSTLALPDAAASDSTYTCSSASDFASASVCVAPTDPPTPVRNTMMPQFSSLSLPPSKHNSPDVPRPVSVLSIATTSGNSISTTSALSTASPLDVDLFDSFPDVPSSMPPSFEQERERRHQQEIGLGLELEKDEELEEEEDPQSPQPPTPPSKSPILRGYIAPSPRRIQLNPHPLPPPPPPQSQSPPPPSPPSKCASISISASTSSLSLSSKNNPRKSKSKSSLKLPHLPHRSSSHHEREKSDVSETHAPSSFPHSSSSIFASITRSLSGRVRSRVNSTASRASRNSEYGSSS